MIKHLVRGISYLSDISLIKVEAPQVKLEARILKALASIDLEVVLITQAAKENSLCLAFKSEQAVKAQKVLEEEFSNEIKSGQLEPVSQENNLSIITIAGENMKGVPGVSGKLFTALAKNGVNVIAIAQGLSELNISVVVSSRDEAKALASIQDAFSLTHERVINLFLVGAGLIGSMLLKQIKEEYQNLREKHYLEIRLCGLAESDKMILAKDGISLENWENEMKKGKKTNIEEFLKKMDNYNLPNSVFVDCTASEDISGLYERVLKGYVSIVTPNKKANSGSFAEYENLKNLAREKNVSFLYETNVGAGLPVINTLRDLITSGDAILKIEAVLSGTLSYIFNNFSTSNDSFSAIVKKAQELGYTEPDPRDDLNGMDVARKILILARETGLPLEIKDVELKPLINQECENAESIPEFFKELLNMNQYFEAKKIAAQKENKVLRYIATLENKKAKVSLEAVGSDHSFYSLSGSDNMISFATKRYNNTPLVVKGPGAGAEVTAGGVLADIIRIAR